MFRADIYSGESAVLVDGRRKCSSYWACCL